MTRTEAIQFCKTNSLGYMRRGVASSKGALALWEAYMQVKEEQPHLLPWQIQSAAINRAFPVQKATKIKSNGCSRCGGTGYVAAFAHIQNGKCFSC